MCSDNFKVSGVEIGTCWRRYRSPQIPLLHQTSPHHQTGETGSSGTLREGYVSWGYEDWGEHKGEKGLVREWRHREKKFSLPVTYHQPRVCQCRYPPCPRLAPPHCSRPHYRGHWRGTCTCQTAHHLEQDLESNFNHWKSMIILSRVVRSALMW